MGTVDMRGMTPEEREAVRAERRRVEAEEFARCQQHAAEWRRTATPEELAESERDRATLRAMFN